MSLTCLDSNTVHFILKFLHESQHFQAENELRNTIRKCDQNSILQFKNTSLVNQDSEFVSPILHDPLISRFNLFFKFNKLGIGEILLKIKSSLLNESINTSADAGTNPVNNLLPLDALHLESFNVSKNEIDNISKNEIDNISSDDQDDADTQGSGSKEHSVAVSMIDEDDLSMWMNVLEIGNDSIELFPPQDYHKNPLFRHKHHDMGHFTQFALPCYFYERKTELEPSSHFNFIIDDILADKYKVVEFIGSAAFSKACECVDIKTNSSYCIKVIRKRSDFEVGLIEIKLLEFIKRMKPPTPIVELVDYFYFREHLFLVTELLKDNLYEFYKFNRKYEDSSYFTLPRLQKICRQILQALSFLHSYRLIHSDIKPENILVKSYSRVEVKLIDFGSTVFDSEKQSFYVQSRSYRSPDVILGSNYGTKIDIWSLGCVIAEIYSGKVLFSSASIQILLSKMISLCGPFPAYLLEHARFVHKYFTKDGNIFQRNQLLDDPSHQPCSLQERIGCNDSLFLNFLRSMLTLDPDKRLSADQLLQHPWMSVLYPEGFLGNDLDLPDLKKQVKYPSISSWSFYEQFDDDMITRSFSSELFDKIGFLVM